jgi:hypothetical protein
VHTAAAVVVKVVVKVLVAAAVAVAVVRGGIQRSGVSGVCVRVTRERGREGHSMYIQLVCIYTYTQNSYSN